MDYDSEQELYDTLKYPPVEYYLDYSHMTKKLYAECAETIDDILWKYNISNNRFHNFKGRRNDNWTQALLEIKEFSHKFSAKYGFTPFTIRISDD